jgi:hypothetical protein
MIPVNWSDFKSLISSNNLPFTEINRSGSYLLITTDGAIVFKTHVKSEDDVAEYIANYQSSSNSGITKKTSTTHIPKVSFYEPEGDFLTYVSHDLTDKTTWYQGAVQVIAGSTTLDSGNTYSLLHQNIINMSSGKLFDEYNINADGAYTVKAYDNGVQVDTDSIDYDLGKITLSESAIGTITCSYFYASDSTWTIKPSAGKVLKVSMAELQFTSDIQMVPVHWEVWAYNPYDLPNKALVEKKVYKNIKDVISIANKGTGKITAFDTLLHDVYVFPFDYTRAIDLKSSVGLEMRIKLENNQPLTGEFATITFYTASEDE